MNDQQQERMTVYSLLARLLIVPVDKGLLDNLQVITIEDQYMDSLTQAWRRLAMESARVDRDVLDDEFHRLFIGLGRSELLPFYSFYETGFLMEKPLVQLRADLKRLGYQRQDSNRQPEDHISAISEVMAMLIRDDCPAQGDFFKQHIQPWFGRFFLDLETTASEPFYKAVGLLGRNFIKAESYFFNYL